MSTRSFTISEMLMKSLAEYGDERINNYLQSQMIVNGFDVTKPYFVKHDQKRHVHVVSQDFEDGEEADDAEDDFQRHGERALSWGTEDDLSV